MQHGIVMFPYESYNLFIDFYAGKLDYKLPDFALIKKKDMHNMIWFLIMFNVNFYPEYQGEIRKHNKKTMCGLTLIFCARVLR